MSIFVDHAMLKHKLKVRGCKAHLSANQSIPTVTWTQILLDVEDFDDFGEFNPVTHQATIAKTGRYLIIASILWSNMTTTTDCELLVARNGIYVAGLLQIFITCSTAAPAYVTCTGSTVVNLNAGDVVDLWAYQSTGSAKTVYGSNVYINTFLVVLRLS